MLCVWPGPARTASPLALPSGIVLPNRLVMAPMVVQASDSATGSVTEEALDYFRRRTRVAGMIITGAAYIERTGSGFDHQLSIAEDADPGWLEKLAEMIRTDGAKAVVQLFHAGREDETAQTEFGRAMAPSTMEFEWLPYIVQELTGDGV